MCFSTIWEVGFIMQIWEGKAGGGGGGFEAFFVQFRGGSKHFCTSQGLGCSLIQLCKGYVLNTIYIVIIQLNQVHLTSVSPRTNNMSVRLLVCPVSTGTYMMIFAISSATYMQVNLDILSILTKYIVSTYSEGLVCQRCWP